MTLLIEKPEIKIFTQNCGAPLDWRIAHIKVNALSFQIAHWKYYEFVVAYHNSKNFNVTAPEIGNKFPVIADRIYKLKDKQVTALDLICQLTDVEKQIISDVPNGWDCNELIKWKPFIGEAKNFRRAQWLMPLHDVSSAIPIHPEQHRPLTREELGLCTGILDLISIPKIIYDWLLEQVTHYENDNWETDDYESRYDGYTEQWLGKSVNGAKVKTFDLTQYYCKQSNPLDYAHIPQPKFLYKG